MKGQIITSDSEGSAAALSASVGQGLFQTRKRFAPAVESELHDSSQHAATRYRVFSRRVGLRYGAQVLSNSLPLLLTDIFTLTATIMACRILFHYLQRPVGIDVTACLVPITIGFILLNMEMKLYPGARLSPVEEMRRLIVSATCMFVVWAMGVYMVQGRLGIQLEFLLVVYPACAFLLPVCRGWMRQFLGKWPRWGIPVLVCGDDQATVRLYHWLSENRYLGFRPEGVVGDREGLAAGTEDTWYAGTWSDTEEIADKRHIFWAVVVPPAGNLAAVSTQIADHLYTIPQVHVLTELTGVPDQWNPQRLDGLAGIQLQQNLMLPLPRFTKRLMDLGASLAGGIVLLPVLFYLAIAVKMSSRGPVLYGHERIGRYGGRFKAWKFRTMFQDSNHKLEQYLEENPEAKEEWERDQKLRHDPRITRIGRFLRKTSLDELPQLWNVICGDMSLVGPRPIVTKEIEKYGPYFGLYTMVKPGITGLWQVSGRNNTTYEERVQLDAYYVRNWSPWVDAFLLLKTIRIVLFARGAY